jgi:hypothetical protein
MESDRLFSGSVFFALFPTTGHSVSTRRLIVTLRQITKVGMIDVEIWGTMRGKAGWDPWLYSVRRITLAVGAQILTP